MARLRYCSKCGKTRAVDPSHNSYCTTCVSQIVVEKCTQAKVDAVKLKAKTARYKHRLRVKLKKLAQRRPTVANHTAEHDVWLKKQSGVCAVCEKAFGERGFVVDHKRSCCPGIKNCGKCIRGLLCFKCNDVVKGYEYFESRGLLPRFINKFRQGVEGV